jgi:hypothetical protein
LYLLYKTFVYKIRTAFTKLLYFPFVLHEVDPYPQWTPGSRTRSSMLAARELLVLLALAALSRPAAAQPTLSEVAAMTCRTAVATACENVCK